MTVIEIIDRQSPVPYYRQVVENLEGRVTSGLLSPGVKLPSENEMREQFGVSRATIRQALRLLADRGSVEWIPYRGAFIKDGPKESGWTIHETEGFLANLANQNREIRTSVIRSSEIVLPEEATQAMRLPPGTRGFELVRVRFLDANPILYTINYSPPAVVPLVRAASAVLAGTGSFQDMLVNSGFHLESARRIVHAMLPTPEIAEHLRIALGDPILRIRSTSRDSAGGVFDFYETWLRSEILPLQVDVHAR